MQRIVVMGVSGAGKTTVGRELAERLGLAFQDADDLHPAANVAKPYAARRSAGGVGWARSRAPVITPSVPSLPTNSLVRS